METLPHPSQARTFFLLSEPSPETTALGTSSRGLVFGGVGDLCILQVVKIEGDCVGKEAAELGFHLSSLSHLISGKFIQLRKVIEARGSDEVIQMTASSSK